MQRREQIPKKPNMPFNLWSMLKQMATKDLTKFSIPVNYCEPLSMLQRMVEDFEYAHILDGAAGMKDYNKQLAYVAAFTVSSYGNTDKRLGKPFNPLLGETHEFDRTQDLGWRSISEQVSHHPPRLAQYIEGNGWKCWQDYTLSMKLKGNYIEAAPTGITHLVFDSGEHYTWKKAKTRIRNIIVGSLWIEHVGDTEILSHTHGSKISLSYEQYNFASQHTFKRVKGYVKNSGGIDCYLVDGFWDKKIEVTRINTDSTEHEGEENGPFVVWAKKDPPKQSEDYYNFSVFTCQLNEPEPGVAPTDSRLRPDTRALEDGRWQEADHLKTDLEDRQRQRLRAKGKEPNPIWFKKEYDSIAGDQMHFYKGQYWECKMKNNWRMCPIIF